ncbi:MAG: hypothetical protein LBU47_01885 [Christensenellaceae bacterium]|jgi:hypothetical protein|nr:hypothetical protein [Christensenellaceae bacterium]
MQTYPEIPFFQQINPDSCGAAALQMLLAWQGVKYDQEFLWNEISTDRPHGEGKTCSTHKILNFCLAREIPASVVVASDPHALMKLCADSSGRYGLMPLIHTCDDGPLGHIVVFVGFDKGRIVFNDPLYPLGKCRRENPKIFISKMQNRTGAFDELSRGNLFCVIGRPGDGSFASGKVQCEDGHPVPSFSDLSSFVSNVLCPTDGWLTPRVSSLSLRPRL